MNFDFENGLPVWVWGILFLLVVIPFSFRPGADGGANLGPNAFSADFAKHAGTLLRILANPGTEHSDRRLLSCESLDAFRPRAVVHGQNLYQLVGLVGL